MPNWCHNEIKVSGPVEKLNEFEEQFKKEYTSYVGGRSNVQTEEDFLESMKERDVEPIAYKVILPKERDTSLEDLLGIPKRNQINYITEEKVNTDTYSFSNFVELTKERFLGGWYDWSLRNWGTKWDLKHVRSEERHEAEEGPYNTYYFSTANSPAKPAVLAMSKQYPELDFDYIYHEPGMQYAGAHKIIEGEAVQSEEIEGSCDGYELFVADHFDIGLIQCVDCQELSIDWSEEKDSGNCSYCNSGNVKVYKKE